MKTELTQSDQECLNAARGLDINHPPEYRNKFGLKPSVADYNKAIKDNLYTGVPIAPIGSLK